MVETHKFKTQESSEEEKPKRSYPECDDVHHHHHHHHAANVAADYHNDHHDDDEMSSYAYAMQIVQQSTLPMVTRTAVELDLFGIMGRAGPGRQMSAAEIASCLPGNNPDAPAMLDRILFLLATYSVVTCTTAATTTTAEGGTRGGVERRYGLGSVAKYFVADEDGVSLAPLLHLNLHKAYHLSGEKLKDAILGGGDAFDLAHGMSAFEYPKMDSGYNDTFNKAMYHHSAYIIKSILRCYNGFGNIETLVDVGGGLGLTLDIITSRHPSIRGINFDLAHVIQHAPLILGVEHVVGDMFQSIPQGDAIFMKWILHDWSDEHCLKILENCYKALPKGGKVILVEMNKTDELRGRAYVRSMSQMDICMMTNYPGGKERTKEEFESLAKAAGFSRFHVVCRVCIYWVMELYK